MVIGRMTRDPEVRTTPSGVSVASFSIATNYTWNDQNNQKQEKVEFCQNVRIGEPLVKNTVEICANCGKIYKGDSETFNCIACGSEVSVVVPLKMFKDMVKIGAVKE